LAPLFAAARPGTILPEFASIRVLEPAHALFEYHHRRTGGGDLGCHAFRKPCLNADDAARRCKIGTVKNANQTVFDLAANPCAEPRDRGKAEPGFVLAAKFKARRRWAKAT